MPSSPSLPKKRMRFIDRKLDNGMGRAVARRTYLRRVIDKNTARERWETWSEVANRVALGNTSLLEKNFPSTAKQRQSITIHISIGSVLCLASLNMEMKPNLSVTWRFLPIVRLLPSYILFICCRLVQELVDHMMMICAWRIWITCPTCGV
jgi:hypothetical protein